LLLLVTTTVLEVEISSTWTTSLSTSSEELSKEVIHVRVLSSTATLLVPSNTLSALLIIDSSLVLI
jgi:hypothetical protein